MDKTTGRIEQWIKSKGIKNATIANAKDNDELIINVDGSVDLHGKIEEEELPEYIQFGTVKGTFDISDNKLTSLRGCPKEVTGVFICDGNNVRDYQANGDLLFPQNAGRINFGHFQVYNFDGKAPYDRLTVEQKRFAEKLWATGETLFLKQEDRMAHKLPIFIVSPETLDQYLLNNNPQKININGEKVEFKPGKQFCSYYNHPFASHKDSIIGLKQPFVLLCLERIRENAANDDEYKWLIGKHITYEFAHAQMDQSTYRPVDDFFKWVEDPLANMICLQCFWAYDKDKIFEFIKETILKEPDNQRLGWEYFRYNMIDWENWAKNKKEIKCNTESKQTYLFYVQKAFSNNRFKIEKMTLTRYFYQMLNA
ncbi:MAG: hypothetical protein J6P49_04875 [Paludibacteraceae bacterium]|nr:hypothetical protein [Paludibacteraceae bacterium]MBO7338391.1 hypothetical protein [Paludibacteraceae bacterium]MBP5136670.1 hypothetical protein [Paludibacteraceae bacterium]MBP5743162.1 hypothetical protein [Paludibacteraceae bacterium]